MNQKVQTLRNIFGDFDALLLEFEYTNAVGLNDPRLRTRVYYAADRTGVFGHIERQMAHTDHLTFEIEDLPQPLFDLLVKMGNKQESSHTEKAVPGWEGRWPELRLHGVEHILWTPYRSLDEIDFRLLWVIVESIYPIEKIGL